MTAQGLRQLPGCHGGAAAIPEQSRAGNCRRDGRQPHGPRDCRDALIARHKRNSSTARRSTPNSPLSSAAQAHEVRGPVRALQRRAAQPARTRSRPTRQPSPSKSSNSAANGCARTNNQSNASRCEAHLPRREIAASPTPPPAPGCALKRIGEDVAEKLDYCPACSRWSATCVANGPCAQCGDHQQERRLKRM